MYIREWKEESFLFFFLHIPFYIFLFEARVFKEKKKSKEEEREGRIGEFREHLPQLGAAICTSTCPRAIS